jgi:hypothetical protein
MDPLDYPGLRGEGSIPVPLPPARKIKALIADLLGVVIRKSNVMELRDAELTSIGAPQVLRAHRILEI